ncbi:MAG: dephospho-CoA kinase [Oscillospiraceae bacterium]|nr:dephospho-CoA kinase [Oscillospiraceae bacterium]
MGLLESDNIRVIGLTGQSGAGKSTVSGIFASYGFPTINADEISHDVASDPTFLEEVSELFLDCVTDTGLDRRKLAGIVFCDNEKLKIYTDIIFPYITREIFRRIEACKARDERLVLLDAPTLFESGLDDICSSVVSVIAPMELKIQRVLERDGIPVEMVKSRLGSQKSDDMFISKSQFTIVNNSDIDSLKEKTFSVIEELRRLYTDECN